MKILIKFQYIITTFQQPVKNTVFFRCFSLCLRWVLLVEGKPLDKLAVLV